MKYSLRAPVNKEYSTIEQVLTNRGIARDLIPRYIQMSDTEIFSPTLLGETNLRKAAAALYQAIQLNQDTLIVVDCDVDGQTSAALLAGYLHKLFPAWVENNLHYFIHSGKQHGLQDCYSIAEKYQLVICPDSSSSDIKEHEKLKNKGIPVIVLDHHESNVNPDDYSSAIVINNQLCNYPNKQLSGVGVTWQFCRYLDILLDVKNADSFLDLVAVGLSGDMESLLSFETRTLIDKGSKQIKNPLINALVDKNAFLIGDELTPFGITFYIVPLINAMCRSGTQEEKELIFESLLPWKAYEKVPSTKRGHRQGEMETKLAQSVRTLTNVKNRQTRAQDAAMETLENMIQEKKLFEHKVIILTLDNSKGDLDIQSELRGLCANKIMAKYKKPCCILSKVTNQEQNRIEYAGSARGCNMTGVRKFKTICENTGLVVYAQGHEGAFGLDVLEENLAQFTAALDEALRDVNDENQYLVDYIYHDSNINRENIMSIAGMKIYWGQDVEEALVAIEGLKVTKGMVTVYRKNNLTLKIKMPNSDICLMLFNAPEDLCDNLQNSNPGYYELNIVGTCNINSWNGTETPQIFINDYEITDKVLFYF